MNLTNQQRYLVLIRLFLSDTPEANRLLRTEESSDSQILLAMGMVLDDWNISDPSRRTFTYDTFPSLNMMLYGSMIHLLRMAGIYNSRNKLNYSAGGLTVNLHDKGQEYMSWLAQIKAEYEQQKVALLRRMNISNALGGGAAGIFSDYILAGMSPSLGLFI